MTQEIKIRFIPDKEADHDAFGVHTQTAKALSEIIVFNINNTIRTIGLLGDWGSGKSTVVKYTQRMLGSVVNRLRNQENIYIILRNRRKRDDSSSQTT